jgi:uncharacterized membrane protein YphA (DoxX/SURF4 family)
MAQSTTLRSRWSVAAPWVTTLARIAVAGILGYAGLIKLSDTGAAVRTVRAYEIFPEGLLLQMVAFGQPALEIGLALLLLVGLASRLTAIASVVLFVIFIAGIISVWARGLSIDCGCFGGGGQVDPSQTRYPEKIAENVGFIALALWVAIFPRSALSLDGYLLGGRSDADDSGDADDLDDPEPDDADGPESAADPAGAADAAPKDPTDTDKADTDKADAADEVDAAERTDGDRVHVSGDRDREDA